MMKKYKKQTGTTQLEYTILAVILVATLVAAGGFLSSSADIGGKRAIESSKDGIPENSYLSGDAAK